MIEIIGITVGIIGIIFAIIQLILNWPAITAWFSRNITHRQPRDKEKPTPVLTLSLHNQTPPDPNFVGRREMLQTLTDWWHERGVRVGALVGWGGFGKSALVRKWYDSLEQNGIHPDGIFWWGFYRNANIELYLNALLNFASGGRISPGDLKSSWDKVEKIKQYLEKGAYLIILDGFETVQKTEGNGEFGAAAHPECREILTSLVDSRGGKGLCVITSRFPLYDLADWRDGAFRTLEVEKLSRDDTRALFRKARVKGTDEEIDAVWEEFGGHALSLTLLIGYLVDDYEGDIRQARAIPPFYSVAGAGGKAHRMLCWYDQQLKEEPRAFMKIFSLFRTNVTEDEFEGVFRKSIKPEINQSLARMESFHFKRMVKNLRDRRLISKNTDGTYAAHPLVRNYFESIFHAEERKVCHQHIYQYISGRAPVKSETLDEMRPFFEQLYHGCEAEMYQEAYRDVYLGKIQRRDEHFLTWKLGGWDTDLALIRNFFEQKDFQGDPLVPESSDKAYLINEAGVSMMNLGKTEEAERLYREATELYISEKDWRNASIGYQHLCDLQIRVGHLSEARVSSKAAIDLAKKANNVREEHNSAACLAYTLFLLGEVDAATLEFGRAYELQRRFNPAEKHLYSIDGIWYADFLIAQNRIEEALEVTKQNLRICERNHWTDDISHCLRSFASIFRHLNALSKAEESALQAISGARKTGRLDIQVQGLLELARIELDKGLYQASQENLNAASRTCSRYSYGIHEADVEVMLGKAYLAVATSAGRPMSELVEQAETHVQSAYGKATDMHYRWAEGDAAHVLGEIYLTTGKSNKARQWLERAVGCRKEILAPKVEESEELLNNLVKNAQF